MRRLLMGGTLGLLLVGFAANAQRYYGDSDGRYRDGDRDLFDHVRADLDRAESGRWISGGDARHLNHAREELGEFVGKWARGKFDKGELDDAIGAIQSVVDHNRTLRYRDLEILQEDANRLRDFRATRGRYYYR